MAERRIVVVADRVTRAEQAGFGDAQAHRHPNAVEGPQGRGRFIAVRLHGAQAWGPQRCERCLPSNVRITPNAGIPAEKEPPRNWGSFPPPAYGGLCRPEVGVPLGEGL